MMSEYETAETHQRKVRLFVRLYGGDEINAAKAIRHGESFGRRFSRSHDDVPSTIDELAIAILLRVLIDDIEMAARYVHVTSAPTLVDLISARIARLPDDLRPDGERAWQRVLDRSARDGDRPGGPAAAGEDARSPR